MLMEFQAFTARFRTRALDAKRSGERTRPALCFINPAAAGSGYRRTIISQQSTLHF